MGWRSTLNGSMWTGSNGLAEGATLMYKSAIFDLSWLQADDRTQQVSYCLICGRWRRPRAATTNDEAREGAARCAALGDTDSQQRIGCNITMQSLSPLRLLKA